MVSGNLHPALRPIIDNNWRWKRFDLIIPRQTFKFSANDMSESSSPINKNSTLSSLSLQRFQSHGSRDDQLQNSTRGMATALSLDYWTPPTASKCDFDGNSPDLAVQFFCMHPHRGTSATNAAPLALPEKCVAARFQEIFCDLVALHHATNSCTRHVLDERFDCFLSVPEKQVKQALLQILQGGLNAEARETRVFWSL
jgi:hypothetical protein